MNRRVGYVLLAMACLIIIACRAADARKYVPCKDGVCGFTVVAKVDGQPYDGNPVVVCVCESHTFSIDAADCDFYADPTCDRVQTNFYYQWKLGNDVKCTNSSWTYSFEAPGSYTVHWAVRDPKEGEPDWEDETNDYKEKEWDFTGTIAVVAVEVASITGPEPCALCQNKNYTFSATTNPEGHCGIIKWLAQNGDPDTQEGGCNFTTKFTELGDCNVKACCADTSQCESVTKYIAEPCGTSAAAVCNSPTEQEGSLPECQWGETSYSQITFEWDACLNCDSHHWKVQVFEMTLQPATTYDWHGKWDAEDPAHKYTCEAAQCVTTWLLWAEWGQSGTCEAPCVPKNCCKVHERRHASDACSIFMDEAGDALWLISQLWRDTQGEYKICNTNEAWTSFEPQVGNIIVDMLCNIRDRMDEIGEQNANGDMAECLHLLLEDICDHLDPGTCDACP